MDSNAPSAAGNKPRFYRYGRLKLFAGGFSLAAIGVLRMLHGIQVVTHGTGQPMFSWGLVAGGMLCIALSILPTSWMPKTRSDRRIRKRSLSI